MNLLCLCCCHAGWKPPLTNACSLDYIYIMKNKRTGQIIVRLTHFDLSTNVGISYFDMRQFFFLQFRNKQPNQTKKWYLFWCHSMVSRWYSLIYTLLQGFWMIIILSKSNWIVSESKQGPRCSTNGWLNTSLLNGTKESWMWQTGGFAGLQVLRMSLAAHKNWGYKRKLFLFWNSYPGHEKYGLKSIFAFFELCCFDYH